MDDVEAHDLLKGEKELKMGGKLDVAPAIERERGRLEVGRLMSSRKAADGIAIPERIRLKSQSRRYRRHD